MGEILLPARAEIDMPAPETSYQRLGIPIIMRAELTVLARILFHTFHVKVNTANVIVLLILQADMIKELQLRVEPQFAYNEQVLKETVSSRSVSLSLPRNPQIYSGVFPSTIASTACPH